MTSHAIITKLRENYPHVPAFLNHKTAFELLIAVILSAQCTDNRVNQVTPDLFNRWPTPDLLANATVDAIQTVIQSVNYCHTKARNCQKVAQLLVSDFNGQVPDTLEALVSLPGVGRKTANVVLAQWFGQPSIAVDTHVARVSKRLGFHTENNPVAIESRLKAVWPREQWSEWCSLLILHGRAVCHARKPSCATCCLAPQCPYVN